MRKINKTEYIRLQLKRLRKKLKRKRTWKPYNKEEKYDINLYKRIGDSQKNKSITKVQSYLIDQGYLNKKYHKGTIVIPKVFSFEKNYARSIQCIKELVSSIYYSTSHVKISFNNCEETSLTTLTVLCTLIENFKDHRRNFGNKFSNKYTRFAAISVIKSKKKAVNSLLYVSNLIGQRDFEYEDMKPVFGLKLFVGGKNRESYTENTKGKACAATIAFINNSIKRKGVELSQKGKNDFDRLLSEILNNSEEHSNTDEWYLKGVLFEEITVDNSDSIAKLELIIFNYGFSFYEGFENNKTQNNETYSEMESLYEKSVQKSDRYSKGDYFTLYALQEGTSRLKYVDEDRGTGTAQFLNAFIKLGSYVNIVKGFKPVLRIISGKTMIICDNEYGPHKDEDGCTYITLNKQKTLNELPSADHLISLTENFPGTIISISIFLSKQYFIEILNGNNKSN